MPHDEVRAAALTQAQEHDHARHLRDAIEREYEDIRRGIEYYIWRFKLVHHREEVTTLAEEVLHEVVVRALERPEAYDTARSAHAWLLGIGHNVLREKIRRMKRDREHLVQAPDPLSENEGSANITSDQLGQTVDMVLQQGESLAELLELVSPQDRLILQYRYVEGLNGHELAAALGIRESAARVRLSRAVQRLSAAYYKAEQADKGGRE